ncbi:phosphoesterase [Paenibacillus sp. 1011MAR3C5]|uniref:2'-5' RNA ligase family protein n=1 Tax=Paenibacillus sp. 1011MAR3C5 TaxID=1675787 RepID=UPI000E6C6163|nr:2'-5' RNA ligase family protein [Paenibacillus sp. 1011MAR3C5]RJE90734.1 phosphoesterase [Paenibacillus sp. 1011MAR3C5]
MLFGIALFPEKEVQDAANSWRIRHDPHYCHIPPHMTLREAEDWSDEKLQQAISHVKAVAVQTPPFLMTFNRVSTFFPVSHVLYYALEDPAPVIKLHQEICSGPLAITQPKYVYTPHVTIGQQLAEGELHDLHGKLKISQIRYTSHVDRVHLLYQTDQGAWTAYQSFQLEG